MAQKTCASCGANQMKRPGIGVAGLVLAAIGAMGFAAGVLGSLFAGQLVSYLEGNAFLFAVGAGLYGYAGTVCSACGARIRSLK